MEEYLAFAEDLARQAGEIIKSNFMLGMQKEWKADNTPLTETDTTINQLVIDSVRQTFSEHSVLAEEGSDLKHSSEYVWVCDPIDGTIPFCHGSPLCTFGLALIRDGEPQLGVIHDPLMQRLVVAVKGKGARLNGRTIHVSDQAVIKNSLIGYVAFKGAELDLWPVAERLNSIGAKMANYNSILYMDMLVACGEFLAAIFPGRNAWDAAAAKVIVEEAGGRMTDLYGNDQRYDGEIKGTIVSNGVLHQQLVDIVHHHAQAYHIESNVSKIRS